jgi:hypothetical protein
MSEEIQEVEEKNNSKIKWSSEKVMSISALFVSAISLFALFYQLNLAREENELIRKEQKASVLPHLSQWYSTTESQFRIVFGNRGVGPAFIKKVDLVLNDSIRFDNTDDAIRYVYQHMGPVENIQPNMSTFTDGRVIPAGEEVLVISINNSKDQLLFQQYLAKNTLDFEIIYEDVYGTRWSLNNKKDKVVPVLLTKEE